VSAEPWYTHAIIYQVRVRSFYDSDADGTGDFRGLRRKLDYVQDLGVDTLWLLPTYPSPLRDDGYDIADYTAIDPEIGRMRDFRDFLKEAHRRGLRVVTELVMNHTSDQHPWFQRARRAPRGSKYRDWYVWSDDPGLYADARIIFQDFETSNWTWDPVAGSYFWHRFYSHQPDLNFDNPAVRRAMLRVLDFWMDLGVDGLRLDAIPYLFEREGTSCENLPETHAFLREVRAHVDARYADRMLLAEANQWPEDAVAYFGDGDECNMAFHFPIMPRLFMAVRMEDRYPIIDILEQTPQIPRGCQWATFLRNHDELTLEMVTDEERDYMYRTYARDRHARINLGIRRRLAPLLDNDRRRIELLNALLFSLPGTPIVYYGDEIGMGDNIFLGDRNGVRTPMQWSPDRNAGFSTANPQRLFLPVIQDPEFHFESVNVETQQRNPSSLLWWMKRIIALRREHPVLATGAVRFLHPANKKVLVFTRESEGDAVLVVANLSRFSQYVELDLGDWEGHRLVELFGSVEFPAVSGAPYLVTLGPFGFHWFELRAGRPEAVEVAGVTAPPVVELEQGWHEGLPRPAERAVTRALRAWLPRQRWFRSKTRLVRGISIEDHVPVADALVLCVGVDYAEGEPDAYFLPVRFAEGSADSEDGPFAAGEPVAMARLSEGTIVREGALVDASTHPGFAEAVLARCHRRGRLPGRHGTLRAVRSRTGRGTLAEAAALEPRWLGAEQSNTTVVFDGVAVMKFLRRVEDGLNPDVEVGAFLSERTRYAHVPRVLAHVRYERPGEEPSAFAVVNDFVANEGDAWSLAKGEVRRFYEAILTSPPDERPAVPEPLGVTHPRERLPDALAHEAASFCDLASLLGRRTAELHVALASAADDPAFAPERFTGLYRRSQYQSMRKLTRSAMQQLRAASRTLDEALQELAARVLNGESAIMARFEELLGRRTNALRTRCHGDFHLGQVLWTGRDFVILDFEGEPLRTLAQRRAKRSPLVDVAGMLRSFHYAACDELVQGVFRPDDRPVLEPWSHVWSAVVGDAFLSSYLEHGPGAEVLAGNEEDLTLLLDVHMLEKALYETSYELNNRPDWVALPLQGILSILERHDAA